MLSKNLIALRKERKLTQDDIANLLNVKRQTYSAYERGVSVPDAYTLQKLATYFGVTTDYLLNNNEEIHDDQTNVNSEPELTLDTLEYALYGEARELDDDEKEELLRLAKHMRKKRKEAQEKGLFPN